MTILQEDPLAVLHRRGDEFLCYRTLALTQRNRLVLVGHGHFFGKAQKSAHGIRACAQYEHERNTVGHVLVECVQVGGRAFYKNLAQVVRHK